MNTHAKGDSCKSSARELHEALLSRLGSGSLVEWHRHNYPTTEVDSYLYLYRRQLERGLSQCSRIFLDTNYWVQLRDAVMGRADGEAVVLLGLIREVVGSRRAICVGHISSVSEIAKQGGESLKASARLFDELTEGLVAASPQELRFFELLQFMAARSGQPSPSGTACWTKIGQVAKSGIPNYLPPSCSEADRRVVEKCALDAIWNMTLEDVFALFGWQVRETLSTDVDSDVIGQVEALKSTHKAAQRSRQMARIEEFSSLMHSSLLSEFVEQFIVLGRSVGKPVERDAALRRLQRVIDLAIKDFKDETLDLLLPNAAITTELFVLHERSSTTRRLTTNDWQDWQHAAVALPYCDYFLTERHLANQLTNVLHADRQYSCRVVSDIRQAIEEMRQLLDCPK